MKRVLALICVATFTAISVVAQTGGGVNQSGSPGGTAIKVETSPELDEAARLNATVVQLFGAGKFDEALPLAKRVVEIREKALGGDHTLVAAALMNLAAVNQKLLNIEESRKHYKRALSIYEKHGEAESSNAINTRQALALMEYETGKAIALLERNLAAREKVSGAESLEVSLTLFPLAHRYEVLGDFDKAEKLFNRFLAIREKLKEGAQDDMAVAHLRVGCLLRKQHKSEEAKKAKAAADQFFGAGAAGKQMQIVEGGVINGKAISKPAPAYPAEAKQVRAQGTIEVQLLVGETGSVLYACATEKGHPSLRRASELAAYSSRFTPTTLNGKPVKVMGVITYNFVLQ